MTAIGNACRHADGDDWTLTLGRGSACRPGRLRGYTEDISTLPAYRGRGPARALIVESLRRLKSKGMSESALAVDSDNPTRATRVYEDCGFRRSKTGRRYRKPLEALV